MRDKYKTNKVQTENRLHTHVTETTDRNLEQITVDHHRKNIGQQIITNTDK